jgi:DNA-binding NarL/FixJ family response regulator
MQPYSILRRPIGVAESLTGPTQVNPWGASAVREDPKVDPDMNPITGTTTVALADDHALCREGIKRLLLSEPDLEVAFEAGSGHQVIDALRREPVDVIVTDLSMPGIAPMELVRRIRAEHSRIPILVLTMHAEAQYALRAFRAGADGYLTKDAAGDQLIGAIRKLAAGGSYVTPSLAERMVCGLRQVHDAPRHEALSNRELEVCRHIVAGRRLTDIAQMLHPSIKTVSTHKARILEKLGVDGTASLVRYGMQHRLFDEDGQVVGAVH